MLLCVKTEIASFPKHWYGITTLRCIISQKGADLTMIWWCRAWFDSTWSGSEQSTLLRSRLVLHTQI